MSILGVQGRWLRHKTDGTIYNYNDVLVKNPAVEEVSVEQAFPGEHIPKAQKNRKSQVDLSTPDAPAKPKKDKKKKTNPSLAEDASRNFGKSK